jgi:hypothetical protein
MLSRVSHAIFMSVMCLIFKWITTVTLIKAFTYSGVVKLRCFASANVNERTVTADGIG